MLCQKLKPGSKTHVWHSVHKCCCTCLDSRAFSDDLATSIRDDNSLADLHYALQIVVGRIFISIVFTSMLVNFAFIMMAGLWLKTQKSFDSPPNNKSYPVCSSGEDLTHPEDCGDHQGFLDTSGVSGQKYAMSLARNRIHSVSQESFCHITQWQLLRCYLEHA